jgi:histidyl-tRNA synthetase
MAPKDKKAKIDLKVPKGTKDWEGKDMVIRDKIFSNITSVFKRHGGVTIDTPYVCRPFLFRSCGLNGLCES